MEEYVKIGVRLYSLMNNNTEGGRLRFAPRRGAAQQRGPLLARNRVIRVAASRAARPSASVLSLDSAPAPGAARRVLAAMEAYWPRWKGIGRAQGVFTKPGARDTIRAVKYE